jgi:hypothetical protein
VSEAPLFIYIFFNLPNLFCPFWEMFCEQQDNTVIHASHMGKYMLHAQELETLQTFTFWLLKLRWHFKQMVTFQFCYMSFFPINCRTRHCIHSRCCLLLLARVCFSVSCEPFLYVTWRIFHSDTFPQFIMSPLFCYIIHKIAICFHHWSSRATPDTPASTI